MLSLRIIGQGGIGGSSRLQKLPERKPHAVGAIGDSSFLNGLGQPAQISASSSRRPGNSAPASRTSSFSRRCGSEPA